MQEVRLQNRMLDQLESKIGDVQDHMITLNEKLKNTLEEVNPVLNSLNINPLSFIFLLPVALFRQDLCGKIVDILLLTFIFF